MFSLILILFGVKKKIKTVIFLACENSFDSKETLNICMLHSAQEYQILRMRKIGLEVKGLNTILCAAANAVCTLVYLQNKPWFKSIVFNIALING